MSLSTNIPIFADTLVGAYSLSSKNTSEVARNIAGAIAAHFAAANLDGVDITLGSNLSATAVEALELRLIEAFSVVDDPEGAAALMELAFLDYLNNGPIADMWAAAVEATKDGDDLHDVMKVVMAGTITLTSVAATKVSTGLTQWITESVKIELDEVPARFVYIV